MSDGTDTFHPIERTVLKALEGGRGISFDKLCEVSGLDPDQLRRGIEWLKFKGLISISESVTATVSLSDKWAAAKADLPERRLANAVAAGAQTLSEVVGSGKLQKDEVNAAVSAAKRNGWIQFGQAGKISPSSVSVSPEEQLLEKLRAGPVALAALSAAEKSAYELLSKRPGYISVQEIKNVELLLTEPGRLAAGSMGTAIQERRLTPTMITSGSWRKTALAPIDVEAPAPAVFPGRSHPLVDVISEIKEIFVGLGFEEIDGPVVQSGFWNFDALYIPQDHSAREMQDTFYVSGRTVEIAAADAQVGKVAKVHRDGWGSDWNPQEAKRAVLRTHTTPVTLRHLSLARPDAARMFSVGRVFRNEKPSYKHLVEFHQVEGVATAPGLSLRDLMGLQKEFYARMGIKKVKFWPTFFPYTEPSLQSMVYNERLEKWVELFGMGIFRPQVTRPLGIRNPVLAWGGGIERIAMLRYGLDDVRDLFGSRLSWLRGVAKCQS